jgi:hypothetical protein
MNRTLTRPSDTLSHPMGEGRGEGGRSSLPRADGLADGFEGALLVVVCTEANRTNMRLTLIIKT